MCIRDRCGEGLIRHYGENPPQEYRDRLEYELSTISRMGYVESVSYTHLDVYKRQAGQR